MFPSYGSMIRHPLPSTGSSRASSPASTVLLDAPTSCRPFRRVSFPSLGGTTPALLFRSFTVQHDPEGQGFWGAGFPFPAVCRRGVDRISQVPGGPHVNMPCSPTPVGPFAPGQIKRAGAAFRDSYCVGPHNYMLSRLNHTAYSLAVYASQRRLPERHARLASGCWPALPGGVGYPLGPNERFQPISPSSFPRLRLAHKRSM